MRTIEALNRDHAAIGKMIVRLEREIDAIHTEGEIDAEAIERLLDFFEEQVDGHHQEKEERVFFARLVSRAGGADAGLVRSLLDDHAEDRELLAAMRCELAAAAYGEPNSLAVLAREARRYLQHQRRHMRWEEKLIFPLAELVLSAQDDGAMWNGFRRLDDVWGKSVARAARSLGWWLDQRRHFVVA